MPVSLRVRLATPNARSTQRPKVGPALPAVDAIGPLLETLRERRAALAHARLVGGRTLADVELRRVEYAAASAALALLGGDPALPPLERARQRLAELATAEAQVARHAQLALDLADAERAAARQEAAHRLAAVAGLTGGPEAATAALAAADDELRVLDGELRDLADAQAALPLAEQLADELAALEAIAAQRQRALAAATRLGDAAPRSSAPEDVAAMQRALAEARAAHAVEQARLDATTSALRQTRAALERGAPEVAPGLRALAERLGGTLLRDRLAGDEVAETDAGWLEARLGPRLDAIVVDVYSSRTSIPGHLVTREFWQDTRRAMKPEGALLINLILDGRLESAYARNLLGTIESVFGRCAVEVLHKAAPLSNVIVSCYQTSHAAPSSPYTDERNAADVDLSLIHI